MSNLLEIIEDYHTNSGGSCGITMVQLAANAGVSLNSLKPLLKELHSAKKIKVRAGINSKLIYPFTNIRLEKLRAIEVEYDEVIPKKQ